MKHWAISVKVLLTISLFLLLFSQVDAITVFETLSQVDVLLFFLAVLLMPISYFFEAMKWQVFIQAHQKPFTLFESMQSVLIGTAGAITTPFHIGKYAAQSWFHDQLPKKNLLVLVFLNGQVLGIYTLIFGAFSLSFFFHVNGESLYSYSLIAIGIITTTILIAFLVFPKQYAFMPKWLIFLKCYTDEGWVKVFFYGFLRSLITIVQFSLLIRGCLSEPTMPIHLLIVVAASVGLTKSLLPFFIGDLGIREAASAYFVSAFGFNPEAGIAAALLIFTINLLIPSLIGLSVIPKLRLLPS